MVKDKNIAVENIFPEGAFTEVEQKRLAARVSTLLTAFEKYKEEMLPDRETDIKLKESTET